ncbi:MAG TPA: zf-HC2 domain-containing protein [Burkholderiales bacterium]|nr:zf-HC2 domain-containing protein [Burkholderiales bacterium]
MNWFELTCREASVLLSQAQERRLGWSERLGLRLHLLACDGCTHFREQLRFIRAAVRRIRDNELPE